VIEVVKSSHYKNDKISINGYSYTLDKRHKDRHYYYCELKKSTKCKCRVTLHLVNGKFSLITPQNKIVHHHLPNAFRSSVLRVENELRAMATKESMAKPAQIYMKTLNLPIVRDQDESCLIPSNISNLGILNAVSRYNSFSFSHVQ
jgi:FLYWCH zinc finger domain